MKLSTRARYGTRALLDIALHDGEGSILLRDIAERQEISPQYLEHLITPLIAAGMVRSMRGARGGVWLAQTPREIKLDDVMRILEGSPALVTCIDDPESCPRYESCVTLEVWTEMTRAINGVLESTTLQDLVDRQKTKESNKETMYYI